MKEFDSYIKKQEDRIEMAKRIKYNILKTNSLSDRELGINDKSLESDVVYKILNFMTYGPGTLRLKTGAGVSVLNLLCPEYNKVDTAAFDLIGKMKGRRMTEEEYNRINDLELRKELRNLYQVWFPKNFPRNANTMYPSTGGGDESFKGVDAFLDDVFGVGVSNKREREFRLSDLDEGSDSNDYAFRHGFNRPRCEMPGFSIGDTDRNYG